MVNHIPRRRLLALASASLLLAACSESPNSFKGVDITGADYANAFSLTDHNGSKRTLADFKGKVVVIFFGYTQCPDVCPTSMSELAEAKRLLGADSDKLQGLFVSVDPERDTPEVMKQYVTNFDPSFLALYAAPGELEAVAKSFKVYYKKVEGKTPTSYTMDHSAGSFVYDPQGRIRLYERYGSGAQGLADDVRALLKG
ncbi:MAG: SCO family protein [Hydrogenophaga sp.]|uniref:SCO family protein n=1 Tax=Hydrogenophaga sp. TaxID=1904254 RepID=UPI001D676C66|nr:SCO family protein [Hydrogenophaga sp.]MBX3610115.1 SCO family protein [Hydrogenophaga sp.]